MDIGQYLLLMIMTVTWFHLGCKKALEQGNTDALADAKLATTFILS